MRLVNVDELKADYIIASTTTNTPCYRYISEEQIKKAPTVKAIPIEWLKGWEEKHKNDPCYCGFVSEEIIKDWEKENEIPVTSVNYNSIISSSVKFPDNVTITQINNDMCHGSVTAISSVKPDPNLKVVGSKGEENERMDNR